MKRRALLWKVYPYYVAIIVAVLVLTALYAAREMRRVYLDGIISTLEARTRLIDRQLGRLLPVPGDTTLDRQCKALSRLTDTRITIVDVQGVVRGDSDEDPQAMENHGNRPEIARALVGDVGTETRFSNTLQRTMMYVAVPAKIDGKIIGVVRTALPITAVEEGLRALYGKFFVSGVVILALATLISLIVFRRLTRPLQDLQEGAQRFAGGRLQSKIPVPETTEIAAVAEAMNLMAADLDTRINTIVNQRNEREAILASMSEGVLALDAGERIVSLNKAAARFLEIDPEKATGKLIHEAVRNVDLHNLVDRTQHNPETLETEVVLPGGTERHYQVHGTALSDAAGARIGTVLVFTDITRLKKLETIRRDFVANVSHELKTPITAITGSVETLLDGAVEDQEDQRRFLNMIARHADRLNSLTEDLLSLSRLESEADRSDEKCVRSSIAGIIESATQACREVSKARRVTVTTQCAADLEAELNPTQIEQAITNLIDNALKASDPDSTVSVQADMVGNEIVIAVEDRGYGIPAQHLPRLFERFYRVDRARSREAGGTGLGLAIVKHIALNHGGRVTVDSSPGNGSTFRMHLPLAH